MKTDILYVGLIDEDGKEIRGKGYKRQKITKWKLDWLNYRFLVDEEISFPTAIKSWGVIVSGYLFSKATGGRKIRPVDFDEKLFVAAKETPRFVGDLEWKVKGI